MTEPKLTNEQIEAAFGTQGYQAHVRPDHPGLVYAGPPLFEVGAPDLKLKGKTHMGEISLWFTGSALSEEASGTGMSLELEEIEQLYTWLGRNISHLRAEREEEEDGW
jgi:hypothetical protein